jgi:hypothetical protein
MTACIIVIVVLFIAVLYLSNRLFKYYVLANVRLERVNRYRLRIDTILTTGKDPWDNEEEDR